MHTLKWKVSENGASIYAASLAVPKAVFGIDRVDLSPSMKYMQIMFHPRVREGGMSERHPTLEAAVEQWRLGKKAK